MKNLLNIDDQVKVIMPDVMGDGATVKVIQIDMLDGKLYYTGVYHVSCPDGGEGYDNSIQFKEGQYIPVSTAEVVQQISPEPKKIRCKIRCQSVSSVDYGSGSEYSLEFGAVVTGSKENEEFFKCTPAIDLKLQVVKKETADLFKPNKEYYLDFIPVE